MYLRTYLYKLIDLVLDLFLFACADYFRIYDYQKQVEYTLLRKSIIDFKYSLIDVDNMKVEEKNGKHPFFGLFDNREVNM